MNENFEFRLQAYLDGELSPREARKVEGKLAQDRDARLLLAELRAVKAALSGNELERTISDSRDFYWSRIAGEIKRQERAGERRHRASLFAGWRRFVLPIAGMALLVGILTVGLRSNSTGPFQMEMSLSDMGSFTFRDHSAGMRVVWIYDRSEMPSERAVESPLGSDIPEIQ